LFFQQQIYRENGESVLLPPGEFIVEYTQGPESIVQSKPLSVSAPQQKPASASHQNQWQFQLKRWVSPSKSGWYSGDHHIHGAGCAHYTSPTEGVTPQDMFRQVAGEGLNVGCILTWGPCFDFQRHFFRPNIDKISRRKTLLKYDIEISGFGSQALGHVCLLNLREQYFPGSDGTKEKGWPTWATPALKWAKAQGGVTGFAHSASGLQIDPARASDRMLKRLDADSSGLVSKAEAAVGLLPAAFDEIDIDKDRGLSRVELHTAIDASADTLPNLAIPEMNSVGAMELPVAVAQGVCDFISTMDTARIAEWNMWYHILNCGFPLKASGETDFPCMSGNSVGQGRVYVQLGNVDRVDFDDWCAGLAAGRSYVSDGYAHALQFDAVSADRSASLGDSLKLSTPSKIKIRSRIAMAPKMRKSVAYATRFPEGGKRFVGDTVTLHGSKSDEWVEPGKRDVELIVNGQSVQSQTIECTGDERVVEFTVDIVQSSWIALRVFPHLHTNPIDIIVDDKPIRASKASARWCVETIEQLWAQREKNIATRERTEAKATFQSAIEVYRQREQQSNP
ncbi:MAG: CehA/McbA family metallohydrolase, partial [Pirellula sp.]